MDGQEKRWENVFHYEKMKKLLVKWVPCLMEKDVEGWMLGYSFVIFSVLATVVNASRDENFEGNMFSFNVLLNDGSWEALVQMLKYE